MGRFRFLISQIYFLASEQIGLCLAILLSFLLGACSASDPNLTSLSSLNLISVTQSSYVVPSQTTVTVSGTCHKSVKSISIYKAGAWIDITDAGASGFSARSVTCSSNGSFTFTLSNLDTNWWAPASLSGQFTLRASVSGSVADTKKFSVLIAGANTPGLSPNSQTVVSSDPTKTMTLRIPANSATSGGYNFKLRFK